MLQFLWKLYCFPGRMSNWFDYMYPRAGRAWGTARRKDNEIAHFFTATGLYALIIGYALFFHGSRHEKPARSPDAAYATPATAPATRHAGARVRGGVDAAAARSHVAAQTECVPNSTPVQGLLQMDRDDFVLVADDILCVIRPGGSAGSPSRRIWIGPGGHPDGVSKAGLRAHLNKEVVVSGELYDPSNVIEGYDIGMDVKTIARF